MGVSRYHRQEILPQVGAERQSRLRRAHALVVGCGALGCVSCEWLARAGVGTLTIIDRDLVDTTNLQRQVLFTESDARDALPKPIAAQRRLASINSEVRVRALCEDLRPDNAETLVCDAPDAPPVGVIIDATDSFETRYLLNDLAISASIPMVYAGVVGTRATTMTILPERGPCLRCVCENPPPSGSVETCDSVGVLGPAVGAIASIQSAEAIKILADAHEDVSRDLIEIDVWESTIRRIAIGDARCDDCPCCGRHEFSFLEEETPGEVRTLCGQDAVQITPTVVGIDLDSLCARLTDVFHVEHSGEYLRATVEDESGEYVISVFPSGRAIVSGTTDRARARSVYARCVGS
ncbi:MAG: ThiF family adenylyltransferase [Phycisphaerales bacterium JB043]